MSEKKQNVDTIEYKIMVAPRDPTKTILRSDHKEIEYRPSY